MKRLILLLLCALTTSAFAQNVEVRNPRTRPVPTLSVDTVGAPIAAATAQTEKRSTALEASNVIAAAAANLYYLQVHNTSASNQFILVINAASLPANGAVSLLCPPMLILAGKDLSLGPFSSNSPIVASTGIVVCNSSTGTFTKTIGSADCIFYAKFALQ